MSRLVRTGRLRSRENLDAAASRSGGPWFGYPGIIGSERADTFDTEETTVMSFVRSWVATNGGGEERRTTFRFCTRRDGADVPHEHSSEPMTESAGCATVAGVGVGVSFKWLWRRNRTSKMFNGLIQFR